MSNANPYAQQAYLNKLKRQVRELLAAAQGPLDFAHTLADDEPWTLRDVERWAQELAAAVAETEAMLR